MPVPAGTTALAPGARQGHGGPMTTSHSATRRRADRPAAAGPDAIQLTVGQAPHLQKLPVRGKPALVLRTDVANVYGKKLPRTLYSHVIADAVEQAVRLDVPAGAPRNCR